MKIIDHVYTNTLVSIVTDIMSQISESEDFVSDTDYEDDEYKQEIRDKIPELVKMVAPALINIKLACHLFFSEEMEEFVKKYNIEIPSEEEFCKRNK